MLVFLFAVLRLFFFEVQREKKGKEKKWIKLMFLFFSLSLSLSLFRLSSGNRSATTNKNKHESKCFKKKSSLYAFYFITSSTYKVERKLICLFLFLSVFFSLIFVSFFFCFFFFRRTCRFLFRKCSLPSQRFSHRWLIDFQCFRSKFFDVVERCFVAFSNETSSSRFSKLS